MPILEKEQEFDVFSVASLNLDRNILLLSMREYCSPKVKKMKISFFFFKNEQYTVTLKMNLAHYEMLITNSNGVFLFLYDDRHFLYISILGPIATTATRNL